MLHATAVAFCSPAPLTTHPRLARVCRRRRHTLRAALAAPSPDAGRPPLHSFLSPAPFTALPPERAAAAAAPPRASHRLTVLSARTPPQQLLHSGRLRALLHARGVALHAAPRALSAVAADVPLQLPPSLDVDALRDALFRAGAPLAADVLVQSEAVAAAPKRLAVFDLDSTLIAQETIDELAAEMHVQPQCQAITHAAMNGEMPFRDALSQRVALLRGMPTAALHAVKARVNFTPGAFELVRVLKRMGCRTAVVSGGFHFLADHVRDALGLDYAFANRLEVDAHSRLTGRTVGRIVDAEYKSDTLRMLAERFQLRAEHVLAVGDGSNDLLMMHSAGLGVAFNAKPSVQNRAKFRVNQNSLEHVLYLLGLSEQRIRSLNHQPHPQPLPRS